MITSKQAKHSSVMPFDKRVAHSGPSIFLSSDMQAVCESLSSHRLHRAVDQIGKQFAGGNVGADSMMKGKH
jgi:hypothetical protein